MNPDAYGEGENTRQTDPHVAEQEQNQLAFGRRVEDCVKSHTEAEMAPYDCLITHARDFPEVEAPVEDKLGGECSLQWRHSTYCPSPETRARHGVDTTRHNCCRGRQSQV